MLSNFEFKIKCLYSIHNLLQVRRFTDNNAVKEVLPFNTFINNRIDPESFVFISIIPSTQMAILKTIELKKILP